MDIHILKTRNCPHCPKATAIVKKVVDGMKGVKVKETYLDDGEEGQKIAMKYHITSVPAILINDNVVFIGVPSESALRSKIEKALNS